MIYRGSDAVRALSSTLHSAAYAIFKDHGANFFRVGCGFDIETTNVVHAHNTTKGKKEYDFVGAFAYHFQLALGPDVFLVRTWPDAINMLILLDKYGERKKARFLMWIANAGFEFQFIRKRIEIKNTFATECRKPLHFRCGHYGRIEVRDPLRLSGGDLEFLADNYTTTKKLTGALDFTKARNSKTPLTPQEEQYCINDVVILSEFTNYCLRTYTDTGRNIPYTFIGIPRMMVRENIGRTPERKEKILNFVQKRVNIKTEKRYKAYMMFLFRGGYTHANYLYCNSECYNVYGYDITSSYPAAMLQSKKFPMQQFAPCRIQTDGRRITQSLEDKCYIFKATFRNIRAITPHCLESKEKIISEFYENMVFFNGRLYKGAAVTVLLTEFDYENYLMFYDWDEIEIEYSISAACGALPSWILDPLRDVYREKENLKRQGAGRKDHPQHGQYMIVKQQVNSFFGMCCTRFRFMVDEYDAETAQWQLVPGKQKYSTMVKNSFLSPYWGIYISAIARNRLCSVIAWIDHDPTYSCVVYYDTDSIYFKYPENIAAIQDFNDTINALNDEFDGLGCFAEIEGAPFTRFKTIGSKRYIKEWGEDQPGKIECIVAGLDGKAYIKKFGAAAFDNFSLYGFKIQAADSKKKISYYVDEEQCYPIHGENMRELSSLAIVDSDFDLNEQMLRNIKDFIIRYVAGT